jgi:hypothetical protein
MKPRGVLLKNCQVARKRRVQRATVLRRVVFDLGVADARKMFISKLLWLVEKSEVDLYLWGECCIGKIGKTQIEPIRVERFGLRKCVAT